MNAHQTTYCPRCGRPGEADRPYCPHCGVPRDRSRSARAAGVAFVLNEVDVSRRADIVTGQQRADIVAHYERELPDLVAPPQTARTRRQAAQAPSRTMMPAPEAALAARP